ncbi:MAG: hypothetical protein LBU80_04855 [Rikenellaceae bacterium]|jgi:hypothetical protein|nr:hypothetical protein [Rikenellaceae bacterium]
MNCLKLFLLLSIFLLPGCGKQAGYDLTEIKSPIIFKGDSLTAYRDPAVLFHNGRFYLFFTIVRIEGDSIFNYTAQSESDDLVQWNEPRILTPRSQLTNFSSPGNVVRFGAEWVMCLQSYPRPDYTVGQMPRYGNSGARLYTMRSRDLINWSEPKLLKVKGAAAKKDMGRMIDPYLVQDKDDPAKWWCFFKQNGISMSYSYDLENWIYVGSTPGGENVCVLVENNEYILFHSPPNGIYIRKSRNLQNWADWGTPICLGQEVWPWAHGRLTAGMVLNLDAVPGINAHLMFFQASGPLTEHEGDFDKNSSIGIAWSKNLINWQYPSGK